MSATIEIVFTKSKKILPIGSWLIKLWTNKPYSHVARAVDIKNWGKGYYQASEGKGKVLIGTVKDDIHDIGKNILKSLLISEGYNVVDIGVDVPIDKFVDEIKNYNPQVVAMSGLLTIAYDSMKATIEAISKAGIRDNLKIIVGGGSTDQKVAEYAGADDFGASAVDGVQKIKNWL